MSHSPNHSTDFLVVAALFGPTRATPVSHTSMVLVALALILIPGLSIYLVLAA